MPIRILIAFTLSFAGVALGIIAIALSFAGLAHAETLILTQVHGYQRAPDADVVKVLRTGGSVWAPIADVQPTERIAVCVDDPAVAVGSTTTCTTRIPGRTDNWQLKSLAIPPPPALGTVTFVWTPVTQLEDGSPLANFAGYTVTVRHQDCDLAAGDPPCTVAPWETPIELANVATYTVPAVKFEARVIVQARLTDGTLGVISDEAAGRPIKLKPAKVTGIHQAQ